MAPQRVCDSCYKEVRMASRLSAVDQTTHRETARYSFGTLHVQLIKASGLCTANYGALQSRVAGSEYLAEPYVAVQMQFKGARFGEEQASVVAPQYFTSARRSTLTTISTTIKRELSSPIWALWSPSPAAQIGLAAQRNSLAGSGKADSKALRRASSLDIALGGDGSGGGSTQFFPDPPRIVGGSVQMCEETIEEEGQPGGQQGQAKAKPIVFSFSQGAATEIVFEVRRILHSSQRHLP
jgi:hypothetical protein